MKILSYFGKEGIIGAFLTGLFVLLRLVLTFLIIEWLVSKLRAALGPGTILGAAVALAG